MWVPPAVPPAPPAALLRRCSPLLVVLPSLRCTGLIGAGGSSCRVSRALVDAAVGEGASSRLSGGVLMVAGDGDSTGLGWVAVGVLAV